jgi:MoxR-like ATPase
MQAIEIAERVRAIGNQARGVFVDREEMISAMERAIVAGEHLVVLGPPGTAKSGMIRFFADAAGLTFCRRVLNPDTTREDLVGPIDPLALREGRWERCWAALATADFALLDEIWKASSQVINMLLDALEERRVTSGNIDMEIPLHVAMAASNETASDETEAMWDRFTIRLVVGYLAGAGDFSTLLTDSHGEAQPESIDRNELTVTRQACLTMAQNPSQAVVEKMVDIWGSLANISTERVSDRRWKRVLVVAAANALLQGRDAIEVPDLIVARDILWGRVDERETIQEWVEGKVNEELAALRATAALISELEIQADLASSLEERARVNYRAAKLLRDTQGRRAEEWAGLRDRMLAVSDAMIDAVENGMSGTSA